MATITAYASVDLSNTYVWFDTVYAANSNTVVVGDGVTFGYFTGDSFQYSSTSIIGGTLTGYRESSYGATTLLVSDFSYPAAMASNLIDANQIGTLYAQILSGADQIYGSSYADHLIGFSGNDTITGSGGNDIIDGGTGTDTAIFSQTRDSYTIGQIAGGFSVASQTGIDGTDILTNVEVLQFSNTTCVTASSNSTTQHVALLYQGALGRTPDPSGLSCWVDIAENLPASNLGLYCLSDITANYNGSFSVAHGFTQSAEFISKYGSLTNEQFVIQLYANVLDREPDTAGLNDWVSQLDNGTIREHVLVGFAESNEAIQNATIGFMGQSGVIHDPWLFLS